MRGKVKEHITHNSRGAMRVFPFLCNSDGNWLALQMNWIPLTVNKGQEIVIYSVVVGTSIPLLFFSSWLHSHMP